MLQGYRSVLAKSLTSDHSSHTSVQVQPSDITDIFKIMVKLPIIGAKKQVVRNTVTVVTNLMQ